MRILAFLNSLLAISSAAVAKLDPLLSSAEMVQAQSQTNMAILDILSDGFGINEKDEFSAGHIAGAVNIPYTQFRPSKNNPGSLIDIYVLENMLEAAELEPTHSIAIVYGEKDATDFGAVARVYWTLKTAGFEILTRCKITFKF